MSQGRITSAQAVAEEEQAESCFQQAIDSRSCPKGEIVGATGGDELESPVAKTG